MSETSRKSEILANPFHLTLLAVSTLFVLTTLAYLASAFVLEPGRAGVSDRSRLFALWIDRNGPWLLGAEILAMLVAGVVMMATDRWFNAPRARDRRDKS